jgi:hypothetical protein
VAVICLLRIYQKIKSTGSRDKTTEVKYTPYVLETQPAPEQSKGAGLYNTEDFYFPPSDIKLHQLNLQVFGKKSN